IMEGKAIPDFKVKLFNKNKYVSNKNLKGKYYIMDFWATWCSPCIAEVPNMKRVYKKYKGKNFEILSISLDIDKDKAKKFIEKNKMIWCNSLTNKGWKSPIVKQFEIMGIPATILVDPTGKIIATNLRGENLGKTLEKILNKKKK
ncbi:TlpA family protein disulfide reductase, partial [bacterium]|nr:TlpA family protein disulfide reductase [bacterium]